MRSWIRYFAFASVVALAGLARAQDVKPTPLPDNAESTLAASGASDADEMIPTKNLLTVLRDGGPLMIPIVGCSVVLLVFVFERLIMLRRPRVIPGTFVKKFLEQLAAGQLDREKALELCHQNKSPVSEVFAAAVKKWGRPAVEVEQAIIDAGERVTNGLRRYLRLFNGISTISPLLGLLGTVTGMIAAFNVLAKASAMGRPEMLAAGISEALITTAAGLMVAIPALSMYLYFVGRVDGLVTELDRLGQQVVEAISAEALAEANKSRRKAA
jgi:biopolymer transport protein ExbB